MIHLEVARLRASQLRVKLKSARLIPPALPRLSGAGKQSEKWLAVRPSSWKKHSRTVKTFAKMYRRRCKNARAASEFSGALWNAPNRDDDGSCCSMGFDTVPSRRLASQRR